MNFLRRFRQTGWIDLLFDLSSNLLEEYKQLTNDQGRLRALAWMSLQVVTSMFYVTSYQILIVLQTFRNWLRIAITFSFSLLRSAGRRFVIAVRIGGPIRNYAMVSLSLAIVAFSFAHFYPSRQKTRNLTDEYAILPEQTNSANLATQKFLLIPTPLVRGGSLVPDLRVDSATKVVVFRLHVPPIESAPVYRVTLTKLNDGATLLTIQDLKMLDDQVVEVRLPTDFISEGDTFGAYPGCYLLILTIPSVNILSA